MQHLDDGVLLAMLDGELDDVERREAQQHLTQCESCRRVYTETQSAASTVGAALTLLDRPAPARQRLAPAPSATVRRRIRGAAPMRRAAVLLVSFAAAASATIPGSPVRQWIGERLQPIPAPTAIDSASEPPPSVAAASSGAADLESGVSVAPAEGRLRIVLTGASTALQVRALLTDGQRGGVYAAGEAANARFDTGVGTIEVIGASAGELRIEIPRAAATATVVIDGTTYLVKDGDQLRLAVSQQDSAAAEVSFRVQR
ncbi:MAG: anti-sigma factor [Gemmatimonadota bacterium]